MSGTENVSDLLALGNRKTDFSVVDVNRKLNPHGISFTWSNSSNSQASWLDCFFISQTLLKGVHSNVVLPCTFSDHEFVCLEFVSDNILNRRCAVWKFNSNLLFASDFRDQISGLILARKSKIAFFPILGN